MSKNAKEPRHKRGHSVRHRLFAAATLSVILLGVSDCTQSKVNRVSRKHTGRVSKDFNYVARRIEFDSAVGSPRLSRKQAEQDLDELEWLLENRYSYLKLRGVDYRAALDSIRASLGDGISRPLFGYQLTKFIALFGDGHSRVASSTVHLKSLCSGFSPFIAEESSGRLVAFKADRSDLLDPDFPFLRAIDRLAVDSWLEAAGRFVAKGSPQYYRYHSIRNLRYIECLRRELGVTNAETVEVELQSDDASQTRQMALLLVEEPPVYGFWPRPQNQIKSPKDIRVESRILKENIGYLRIIACLSDPEFLDDLIETMNVFKDTTGLVIDLRTNGGGSRAPLRTLLPFFMAENDPPRIVNVAAYRLGTKNASQAFEARYLYPASSPQFSEAERAAIGRFAAGFEPEWTPPQDQFSQWHYFVISATKDERYFHYDRPVVILMDRWNFSALDIFLGAFKGHKNVTLMGQPSGGGSGCYQRYRLANSKIRIHLSSMASFQPNGKLYDGNGIQPDVFAEPIPTDLIGKTDSLLEAAIQSIQNND